MTDMITSYAITYGLQLLYALLILIVGLRVAKVLKKMAGKAFAKTKMDEPVVKFMTTLTGVLLKILVITIILGMFGVEMTSFIAVLAAASFAIGMALQGSLSNFAGGVLILTLKPFTVGDVIESPSGTGKVTEIDIFYTHLLTPDNKVVVVPNGALSNAATTNYSKMPTRRVDLSFGVSYDSDIEKVKKTIAGVIGKKEAILSEPAPFIRLSEHGDSALVYTVRVWCNAAEYWNVYFDLMEEVKDALDASGIDIPYPHMKILVDKEA